MSTLLGALSGDVKRVLTEIFNYVLPNTRFGPISHQDKSESFQAYWLESTTPAASTTEGSIVHGMGRAPYLAVLGVRLDSTGGQMIPLTISRKADSQRIYYRSTSTSAPFAILAE